MDSSALRIFIGYDSSEAVAYHVCAHSILTRATKPVSIQPLIQPQLRSAGLYTRSRQPTESTAFSFTRFLVPYLAGYRGYALFLDCDMLCQADIWELMLYALAEPGRPVYVCPHDYTPTTRTKFLGQPQIAYPRKNWSSLMLFDCGHEQVRRLTPETVSRRSAAWLHQFGWASQDVDADETNWVQPTIGVIPLDWNWLVGEYVPNPDAKILHYTLGGPWFADSPRLDPSSADAWYREFRLMTTGVSHRDTLAHR
jgi:hypothetical protein